jgi:uncharacterized membrane protein
MRPDRLLSAREKERVIGAIREAESRSAGEIVVRVIGFCLGDTRRRAEKEFFRLGVHRTRDRSGVLILLVLSRRRIEVVADEGISARVPQPAWDFLVAGMAARFREGAYAEGLVTAVEEIGALLAEHFPRRHDDTDELPNDIV